MEIVSLVLLLLLAVVASAVFARILPDPVPAPLVQIALGFAIGQFSGIRVELEPELFFFLFLPPLLFLDGWRIPKDELARDLPFIVELALGLVIVTVLGSGFLIHWMIPAIPLPVAFALGAVLSPTDPIAVSAIAERVPVPPRMMHILEGESLFNDASGLVCLRFAIAAALTGTFHPGEAALAFAWSAGAALAIGVAITYAVSFAQDLLGRRFGSEPGAELLVSLLIPFGAYLVAEHAGASGILAAVAAGVAMTFAERHHRTAPETRLHRRSVWDAIQFTLNGIIFVLLGEQIPVILQGAVSTVETAGHQNAWWLLAYVLGITAGLALLRFGWVWASMRLTILRRRELRPFRSSDLRLVAAASVAGVRGAITLAGVLTLPLAMGDGAPFPARDLAIFLAAGVILCSLLVASVALPMLLNGLVMPADAAHAGEEDRVRSQVYKAALEAIEARRRDHADDEDEAPLWDEAATRIGAMYAARVEGRVHASDRADTRRREAVERELRLAALRAGRAEALRLVRARQASSELIRRLVRELDLVELRYAD